MYSSEFSKHWDKQWGFTKAEAELKKQKVEEAHRVGSPTSKWGPAMILPDPEKMGGYKVVICTKE